MAEAKVGILIEAQDKATAVIKDVQARMSNFNKSLKDNEDTLKKLGVGAGIVFAGISAVIYKSVQAAGESAKVQAQLNAVLKSTHGIAGLYIDDLNDQAKALQKLTTYSDEAVGSAQAMLLTFTNVKGGVFQDAIGTILDMSTALGQDLQSSAIQVGKALNDPILGVTALRKVGVNFNETQQETIKKLVESGKTMEAQKLILSELATEFGGSASAQAQTFAGRLEQLKVRFGDIFESIGTALIPIIEKLTDKLAPVIEKIITWIELHPKLTTAIIGAIFVLSGLTVAITALGFAVLAFEAIAWPIVGIVALIVVAIASWIYVGYQLYQNWDLIVSTGKALWEGFTSFLIDLFTSIGAFFTSIWGNITNAFTTSVNFISGLWTGLWNGMLDTLTTIGFFIIGVVITILDMLLPNWQLYLETIALVWATTWVGVRDFFVELWNELSAIVMEVVNSVVAQFNLIKTIVTVVSKAISQVWNALWNSVRDVFKSVWDSITSTIKSAVDYVAKQVDRLLELLGKVKALGGNVSGGIKGIGSSVSDFFSDMVSKGKSAVGVNDAIISPDGKIITTHPDDYLIATKNPAGLASGGGVTIHINGGMYLDQNSARKIGDEIIRALELQFKY